MGRVRRDTSGGARGYCGAMSGRASAERLMAMAMGTGRATRQFCLGHREKRRPLRGNSLSIMYTLVLEYLVRHLLLAGLKLYLSMLERKPIPLRLEKY